MLVKRKIKNPIQTLNQNRKKDLKRSPWRKFVLVSTVTLSSMALLSGCFKKWTWEEVEGWYEKNPETFTEYMEFAREKTLAGKTDRAEQLYKEAISMTDAEFGSEDMRIATAAGELAELYEKQGRFVESEKYFRQAYEVQKKHLPPGNRDLTKTKKSLAGVLMKLYKKDEADYILTGRRPATPAKTTTTTSGDDGQPRRKRQRVDLNLD